MSALCKTSQPRQSNSPLKKGKARSFFRAVYRNKMIYLLFLPTMIYFIVFAYVPFYWIQIAFKDFKIFSGVAASEWVGFKHFASIFSDPMTGQLIFNTLRISILNIIFAFPVPILFALLLNEVVSPKYKKIAQTASYFPHFLSWVVYAGVIFAIVGPNGALNNIIKAFGGEAVNFVTDPDWFLPLIIISGILKGFGWGSIMYLAGISGIDTQLYEAACMDGAGRLRQAWHVTLPGIKPLIGLNLCMAVAGILNASFDQVFMFLNNNNKVVGEIIGTYVYKMGMLSNKYEYATAVGLLQGIISTILLVCANQVSKKLGEKSLW